MGKRRVNGASIRALREARGIRQADLARSAGLSATHLNQIESGHKQPSAERLDSIATALGVEVEAVSYVLPHLVVA